MINIIFIWFAIGISNYIVYEMKSCTLKNLNKNGGVDGIIYRLGEQWVVPIAVITTIIGIVVAVPLWPISVYIRLSGKIK